MVLVMDALGHQENGLYGLLADQRPCASSGICWQANSK
jgi:hypothetical protein